MKWCEIDEMTFVVDGWVKIVRAHFEWIYPPVFMGTLWGHGLQDFGAALGRGFRPAKIQDRSFWC